MFKTSLAVAASLPIAAASVTLGVLARAHFADGSTLLGCCLLAGAVCLSGLAKTCLDARSR